MGDKHSKKPDPAPRGAGEPSPALRAQIAALAEQVRALSSVPPTPHGPVPADPGPPAPAGVRAPPVVAAPPERTPPDLAAELLGAAERVAEAIRASARREAERVRDARREAEPNHGTELASALRRQRAALAVLSAEIERLEQGTEILRTQLHALEAELAQIQELLRTPPLPRRGFSAPAA